jgi:rhombotarget A family protien
VTDGIDLNNLTIADNSAPALRINAQTEYAYVTNNIVLGNGNADCELTSGNKAIIQNNVASASCGTGQAIYPNTIWNDNAIFANGDEGKCQNLRENKDAILCPFITPEKTFLGFVRPRILLKYNSANDSPIVNQGRSLQPGLGLTACETNDQRMIGRLPDNSFCDRGAIEITVPDAGALVGKNILTGQIAKFSIADKLGESDLIPKEECQALVGDHPQGEAWQDGCLKIEQPTTGKGKTTIDIEGNVTYTPDSAWHGSDIFELQVITSSTRFNKTKPYLVLRVQIAQDPSKGFENKSVKTSGGAIGFASLLGLIGLLGLRRRLSA